MSKKKKNHRELLDKDVVIHYHMGFDRKDYKSRIDYITAEIEKVRVDFDHNLIEKNLASYKAHSYLDANKFELAIEFFQKQLTFMEKSDPFYLFPIQMLIRCYGEIGDFEKGLSWFEKAVNRFDQASGFDKLSCLQEYVHLIKKTENDFQEGYAYLINEITEELGFPKTQGDSADRISELSRINIKWNRKTSEIHLLKLEDTQKEISLWQNFIEECEVAWYKDYAKRCISGSKNRNKEN